jgi:hypothetical protein
MHGANRLSFRQLSIGEVCERIKKIPDEMWAQFDDVLAKKFVTSSLFLASGAIAMCGYIKFPPWRYYTHEGLPVRIWNIKEVDGNAIACIVRAEPTKIKQKQIVLVRPYECAANADTLVMVTNWTRRQQDLIERTSMPENFTNPENWTVFRPRVHDCGNVHSQGPINYDMTDDEIWSYALSMIETTLRCCRDKYPAELLNRFNARVNSKQEASELDFELITSMLEHIGINISPMKHN